MPRKPHPKSLSQRVAESRQRAIDAGAVRLTVMLSADAVRALDALRAPGESRTAALHRVLRDWREAGTLPA